MKNVIYILILFAIISTNESFAQNPPVKQWHWSSSYNNNSGNWNLVENWFYHVISTSDGGFIGVGFTEEKVGGVVTYSNPSAAKVDANGKQVWSAYYNEGNSATGGNLFDAIEVSDGYVFVGGKGDPSHSLLSSIYVIKVNKNTGAKISSFYYNSDPAVLPGYSAAFPGETPVGASIRPIYTAGTLTGYIIAGTNLCTPGCGNFAQSSRGMTLVKTNASFVIDAAFGSGGWAVYNRNAPQKQNEKTYSAQVRVVYNNNNPLTGTPTAYMVTGSTINSVSVTDRDACILKTSTAGAKLWMKSYSDNQTTGCDYYLANTSYSGGYVDIGAPDLNCCPVTVVNENSEEAAGDFEQTSTTEATICGTFDAVGAYLGTGGTASCSSLIPLDISYADYDAVLFRVNLTTGAPMTTAPAPTNAMHNGSIDFKTRMVMDANYIYLAGGNCSDPNFLTTDIGKFNRSNFTQVWKQSYISQNNNVANCTFGLALSKVDGGIAFGGNNELNDEDYFITKLYNDCQTNLTGLTYSGGFVAPAGITTWGAGTKTIRGVVRVPSGATLRINSGAVIRFADTRRYNDFDFLAANVFNFASTASRNSQPTKIIVERGGRLEIDGSTTVLRGLNVCGGEAMWEGIEIYGLSTVSQSPNSNQGFVQVTNGAVVENMYAGYTVGRNAYDAKGQTAHITSSSTDGGGILRMTGGSKIKNSRYGVFFFPYPTGSGSFSSYNQSFFTGAIFECSGTQPLVDPNYIDNQANKLGTDIFVYPVLTNTIRFSSDCKFIGNPNLLVKYRGVGIWNGDASLSVVGTLGAGINNFSDLLFGIYSGKVTSTRSMYVAANRFTNCAQSINLRGGSYGSFYNNDISIPIASNTPGYTPYGVYLSGTPSLYVGTNRFLGLGTGAASDNNFGLLISDHGTSAASVWDNDFGKSSGTNGLYIGAQPQRTNGISGTNTQGLQLNCNRFYTANYYDWVVPNSQPSILPAQGQGSLSTQTQAGNCFNDGLPCGIGFENINSSYAFNYFNRTFPACEIPNCKTANVIASNSTGSSSTCVPDPPCNTPPCASALRARMESETDAVKKEILRNSLIIYYIAVADTPQAAIDLLVPLGTDDAKKKLVTAYIYQQQYTNAQNTLNSIASVGAENIDFKALHQILLDLANTGQTIYNLTGTQTTTITNIANGSTSNKYAAQVILSIAKGNYYADVIDDIGGGGGAARSIDSQIVSDVSINSFVLFPNPTQSQLTVQLNTLPQSSDKIIMQIFDLSGKLVLADEQGNNQQQFYNLDVSNIENGIYFVRIVIGASQMGTKKFVINH